MKAIAIIPGKAGARLVERPEPAISSEFDIKLKVIRVGICGTDREEVKGGRALLPTGQNDLVIGHEMFGQVAEIGSAVKKVKVGDFAVFTVRRGCGLCIPCQMGRMDMCLTGKYHERGIWGLDGYQTEFVVDKENYLIPVPSEIQAAGVLTEPLSVAEKAIDEAVHLQLSRLATAPLTPDWLEGRPCLVAGLGPIGLLASVALILRGADVYGLDIVDKSNLRATWLEHIGGHYIDGREVPADKIDDKLGPMDLIFEATGIARLAFSLLDALATNGAYVLTGIPGGNRPLEITGGKILRRLVLSNQLMIGSVNASPGHFQMAVRDLATARLRWGGHLLRLITHRHEHNDFETVLGQRKEDEIKAVIEWGKPIDQAATRRDAMSLTEKKNIL